MNIDFDAETPNGVVSFKGDLTKDEVSFLLRFAILSLMARGVLPVSNAGDLSADDDTPVSIN